MPVTSDHNTPEPAADAQSASINKPAKRSWWGRHWKWAVPVGCLTPILICGGFFTLIFSLVFGLMKSSHPYEDSLATLQADQRVISALGSPIDANFLVMGEINLHNQSGNADITYSVTGPQDSAGVHVVASKAAGQWTYQTFTVIPESTSQPIDMLATP